MAFYRCTEKLFRVLKSTSKSYGLRNRARGNYFENLALNFFKKQNLAVRWRNHRIWGVEHDFVVSNCRGELLFVEVKSLSHIDDLAWRLKPGQKKRLLRSAKAFVESSRAKSLGVWLLAIEASGKTHFIRLEEEL